MEEDMQTGEEHEAAAPESMNNEQESAHQPEGEHNVPLSALQAERRERQRLADEVKMMQEHVQLLRANSEPQAKQPAAFDTLEDDDILTVGQAKKQLEAMQRSMREQTEELRMSTAHQDYNEVITKWLPEAIKENPKIADWIKSSNSPYEQAYYYAKRSDAFLKEKVANTRSPAAQKVQENMSRPGNLSSMGSNSAVSQPSMWREMSDADFMRTANKNLG